MADFRDILDRVQDVDGEKALTQKDDEAVPCPNGQSILFGEINAGRIRARITHQAGA
ncbi:hypothetical protein SDC9_135216 [bioreactor metagenome]|uniref:Uncharacterized protein n=1 Tax=bioreactor metagenome TaxID=1076179 RepID=A0A645DFW6_9ZZZZ